MDFSTLEKNLKSGVYAGMSRFKADLVKIWANSYRYNDKSSPIYKMAQEMEKSFRKLENSIARKSQKLERARVSKSSTMPVEMSSVRQQNQQREDFDEKIPTSISHQGRNQEFYGGGGTVSYTHLTLPTKA